MDAIAKPLLFISLKFSSPEKRLRLCDSLQGFMVALTSGLFFS